MPRAHIVRESSIVQTARVMQMQGIFDVAPSSTSREEWLVDLPLDEKPWQIGMIVGPSGCGKTTIARELFGADIVEKQEWPPDKSILDGFPANMGIKDIVANLSAVGFSAPPSWLRPFHVLSNGQQFRVMIARALADNRPLTVVDEFTSVVDRTVAQIGSHAIAKAIRRTPSRKFVAVACHYDILEWLQPDWVFYPESMKFEWRLVQPRPAIQLNVRRVHYSAWNFFKKHHYMSAELNNVAHCFVAFLNGAPIAFYAVLPFPHAHRPGWRATRAVVLPDYQGAGISTALTDWIASVYSASGKPFFASTSNPALIKHHARSPLWKMTKEPKLAAGNRGRTIGKFGGTGRLSASFEYVGPVDPGGFSV